MDRNRLEIKHYAVVFLTLCSLVFGASDIEHGANVILTGDGATLSMTANDQTVEQRAHPSATESYTNVWPAAKGTPAQALIIDSVVGNVVTWTVGIPSPVDTHILTGPNHSDAKTVSVVLGDIMIGTSDPLWSRLPVGTALGGAATGFLGHDGTNVGNRTLAQVVSDLNTPLDLEYLRLDTTNNPLTGDLDLGGNDILSSGALSFKVSGDNEDYINFETIANRPFINIIGGDILSVLGDRVGNTRIRLMSDSDTVFSEWFRTGNTTFLTSAGSYRITTQNDNDINLLPDGTGVVNISTVANGIFPTASSHLATKEYVDSAITFIEEYFFGDTLSNIGGIYFDMIDMPTGEAESEHSIGSIDNTDGQPLVNFATIAGVPGLITLDAGIYSGNIHALKSSGGQRGVKIYFEIHSREPNTVETLLVTSEESEFLTVAEEHYTLHATLQDDVSIATTDRIIVKWFANGGTGGGNATVLLRQEGDTSAHLNVPISSNILSQIYLRQDGQKPLTDNWAVGGFDITGIADLTATGEIIAGNISLAGDTITFLDGSTIQEVDDGALVLIANDGQIIIDSDLVMESHEIRLVTDLTMNGTLQFTNGSISGDINLILSAPGRLILMETDVNLRENDIFNVTDFTMDGTFTDGTMSLTAGVFTDVVSMAGADLDITAGTGDYTGQDMSLTLSATADAFCVDGVINSFEVSGVSGVVTRARIQSESSGTFTAGTLGSVQLVLQQITADLVSGSFAMAEPKMAAADYLSQWSGDVTDVRSIGGSATIINRTLTAGAEWNGTVTSNSSGGATLIFENIGSVCEARSDGALIETAGTLIFNAVGGDFMAQSAALSIAVTGTPEINYIGVRGDGTAGSHTGDDPETTSTGGLFTAGGADDNIGIKVNDVSGGTTHFAIQTGTGDHAFGGASDKLGFYAKDPVALQTGVAVTDVAIHAALVNLGLITGP